MGEIHNEDIRATFNYHLQKWCEETGLMSTGNFDNPHFDAIVNMGEDAVPFILEIISERPSMVVHALDLIFLCVVKYEGFVPLEKACRVWTKILLARGYGND